MEFSLEHDELKQHFKHLSFKTKKDVAIFEMLAYLRLNTEEISNTVADSVRMVDCIKEDLNFVVELTKSDEQFKVQELIEYAKKAKLWLAFMVHQPFSHKFRQIF